MGITKPEPVASLPLRNAVLFPMSVVPINVARPRSVRLVEELAGRDRALVGVVSQRTADTVEPTFDDVHPIGTLARVVKVIRLGQANYSVVLNGLTRFRIESGLRLRGALPLRWKFRDWSPNSLTTGTWEEAQRKRQARQD